MLFIDLITLEYLQSLFNSLESVRDELRYASLSAQLTCFTFGNLRFVSFPRFCNSFLSKPSEVVDMDVRTNNHVSGVECLRNGGDRQGSI